MISLRVAIMVLAVIAGLANVQMDSTVTIAQVIFKISNRWFAYQNFPIELFINLVKLLQQRNNYNFCCCFYSFLKNLLVNMTYSTN